MGIAMEQAVRPFLDQHNYRYEVAKDDVITFNFGTKDYRTRIVVVENETSGNRLITTILQLISFPDDLKGEAEALCRTLSLQVPGKCSVDSDGGLLYILDLPVDENSLSPGTYEASFDWALLAVRQGYREFVLLRLDGTKETEEEAEQEGEGPKSRQQPDPIVEWLEKEIEDSGE